ncbi:MAG: hypothetical protein IJO17_01545 [Alistipes sp.]|nr:hypothetical protein [Alistipes sp.]
MSQLVRDRALAVVLRYACRNYVKDVEYLQDVSNTMLYLALFLPAVGVLTVQRTYFV